MREIRFRGKSLRTGDWVYGSLVVYSRSKTTSDIYDPKTSEYIAIDKKTIGQYIGLKDKNGVEAYQDDLYRPWEDGRIYQITYDDQNAAFVLKQVGSGKKWPCNMMMIPYSDGGIIGNIHENPELLDGRP